MVAVLKRKHDIGWLAPSPTWSSFGALATDADRTEFLRPTILRFAHDDFMEELLAALAYYPQMLGEWRAVSETWEKPMPAPPTAAKLALREPVSTLSVRLTHALAQRGALAAGTAGSLSVDGLGQRQAQQPLKLYQPVHNRHYLVAASLVCRTPGLPDRRIDAGKQERISFVLRRIVLTEGATSPSEDSRAWDEYAFVHNESGDGWQRIKAAPGDSAEKLLPGEERLPLFAVGFNEDSGRKRRLLGGVIPAGRREAYVGAKIRTAIQSDGTQEAEATSADKVDVDPRLLLFQMRVTGPWNELIQQSLDEKARFEQTLPSFLGNSPPATRPDPDVVKRVREQAQTVSWYVLLDFERFLYDHLPRIWEVLAGKRSRSDLDASTEDPLLAWLESVSLNATLKSVLGLKAKDSLLEVLTLMAQDSSIGEKLERVEIPYDNSAPNADWPGFLFPLADAGPRGPLPFTVDGTDMSGNAGQREQFLAKVEGVFDALSVLIESAMPARDGAVMPVIKIPSNPKIDTGTAWFAIRCVYERPNCGPINPPALSEPTQPFQMASFFDPDAPARSVSIPLPRDISPAGLRKFNKSATLQISDTLCGQLKRIRKMTLADLVLSVLPWPFHKDLPDPSGAGPCKDGDNPIGMFCSLSIPIVTLCALVLLIIIVSLFDIFFRWLPYLFLCLPIPGFKGKSS